MEFQYYLFEGHFYNALEEIRRLRESGLEISIEIFGSVIGCEYASQSECQKAINPYLDEEWVMFHGAKSRQDVIEALKSSDIVWLPSFYQSECQPLALIDAMVMGNFLIVSDSPALRATVGSYAGVLFLDEANTLQRDTLELAYRDFVSVREDEAMIANKRFSEQNFDHELSRLLHS